MKNMSWKRPVACLTSIVFSLSQLVPPAYALRPSASAQSPTFQHDFAQEFPEALATRLGSDNLSWQAEDILGQAVTEGRAFVLAGSGARKPEEVVVSYLEAYQRRFPTSTPPVESAAMTSRIRRAGDALTQAFAQISVVIDGQTVPAPSRLQAVVVFTEADDPALIGRVGDVRHRALIAYGAVHRSLPISLLQLEAFLEQGEPGRQALIEYLRIFAQSVVAGSYAEVEEGAVARVDAALASTQRQHGQTDWRTHRQQFVQAHTQHALDYARTMNVSAGPAPTAEHADALTIPAAAVAVASTTPPSPQASAFLAAFRPTVPPTNTQPHGPGFRGQDYKEEEDALPLAAMAESEVPSHPTSSDETSHEASLMNILQSPDTALDRTKPSRSGAVGASGKEPERGSVGQVSMRLRDDHARFSPEPMVLTATDERIIGPDRIAASFEGRTTDVPLRIRLGDGREVSLTLRMPADHLSELIALGWTAEEIQSHLGYGLEMSEAVVTLAQLEALSHAPIFFAIVDGSERLWEDHLVSRDAQDAPHPQIFMNRALVDLKQRAIQEASPTLHAVADAHVAAGFSRALIRAATGGGPEIEETLERAGWDIIAARVMGDFHNPAHYQVAMQPLLAVLDPDRLLEAPPAVSGLAGELLDTLRSLALDGPNFHSLDDIVFYKSTTAQDDKRLRGIPYQAVTQSLKALVQNPASGVEQYRRERVMIYRYWPAGSQNPFVQRAGLDAIQEALAHDEMDRRDHAWERWWRLIVHPDTAVRARGWYVLEGLLRHADPAVRAAAWETVWQVFDRGGDERLDQLTSEFLFQLGLASEEHRHDAGWLDGPPPADFSDLRLSEFRGQLAAAMSSADQVRRKQAWAIVTQARHIGRDAIFAAVVWDVLTAALFHQDASVQQQAWEELIGFLDHTQGQALNHARAQFIDVLSKETTQAQAAQMLARALRDARPNVRSQAASLLATASPQLLTLIEPELDQLILSTRDSSLLYWVSILKLRAQGREAVLFPEAMLVPVILQTVFQSDRPTPDGLFWDDPMQLFQPSGYRWLEWEEPSIGLWWMPVARDPRVRRATFHFRSMFWIPSPAQLANGTPSLVVKGSGMPGPRGWGFNPRRVFNTQRFRGGEQEGFADNVSTICALMAHDETRGRWRGDPLLMDADPSWKPFLQSRYLVRPLRLPVLNKDGTRANAQPAETVLDRAGVPDSVQEDQVMWVYEIQGVPYRLEGDEIAVSSRVEQQHIAASYGARFIGRRLTDPEVAPEILKVFLRRLAAQVHLLHHYAHGAFSRVAPRPPVASSLLTSNVTLSGNVLDLDTVSHGRVDDLSGKTERLSMQLLDLQLAHAAIRQMGRFHLGLDQQATEQAVQQFDELVAQARAWMLQEHPELATDVVALRVMARVLETRQLDRLRVRHAGTRRLIAQLYQELGAHQGSDGPGAASTEEPIDPTTRRLQQLEQWLPRLAALNVVAPTEAQQQELTQLLRSFATWQAEDPALWAESLTAVLARLPEAAAPLRALLAREAPGLLPAQPEATPVTPVKAGAVQNAHPPKQSSTELDAAFTAQAQHVLDGVRHVLGAGVPPGLSEAAVDGAYGDASGERARLRTVIQEALRPELSTDEPMPSILFLDPSGSRSLFWVNGASRAVHVSAQDHALYFSWPAITTILEFLEARGERGVQAIAFATFVRMAGFTDEATAALTHERYPGYDDVTLLLGLLAEDEGEPPTTSAGAPAAEEPSATNATVDLLTRDTVVRNQQEVAWQSTPQLDMPRGTGLNPLGWFQQMIQQRATQSPDGQPPPFSDALQEWDVTVVRYPSGSYRCAFGHHIIWGFNYVHPSGVRIELGQDEVVSFGLLTESAKDERKRTYRLSAQEANDQQPSLSGSLAALRDHLPALLASGRLSPEDLAKLKAFAKLAGTPGYYSLIDVLGQSVEWEGRLLPLTSEDLQRFYELASQLADTGVIQLDRRRVLPTELQRLRLQIASAVQQAQRGDPSGWDRIAAKYSQLLENIAAFSIKVAALVRFFGLVRSAERPAAAKAPAQLQHWAFIASGPAIGARAMTHLRTLLAALGLSLGGMTFTDVDFSQAMLDQGQAAVAALRDEGGHPLAHQTVRADIANEPLTTLEAHSFDVVETGLMGTLGEAANHAGFSKKIHLLLELNRILDDGGYLLLTFKNKPLPPAFQQTLAERFGLTILSPERPDLGYDADTLQRLTNGDAKKRAKLQTHLRGASYCVAVKTHTLTDPEREAIRAQQDAIAKTLVYDDSDEAPPGRPGRPRAPPTQAEETDIADVDYTRLTLEQADEAVIARETIQTDPEYEAFEERLAALLFGRAYLQPSEQALLDRLVSLWDVSDVEVLRASHVGFVMDRPSQATGERRLQVRQLMRHHPHLAPRLTQQLRDKIEAAEQPLRVSLARLHGDLTTADLAEMARAERQAERTFLNAELTLWQLYELEEAHRAQANLPSVFETLRAPVVGQMRQALQRGRPDLLERYLRWARLTPEEQDAFREAVYGLTHSDWNSWGFWRGSAINALLRFFSNAHLSPLGFGLRWSTAEEGVESVRYVLQQQRPDLVNQYDRWDTLTLEEQTTFRLECYSIQSSTIVEWGLGSAHTRDRAPYFEGSYITALQMVFPKAALDRRGFESDWGTLEQGIEKVHQAFRAHRPELLEQYARWETLTPEEQTTFRLECYPIQQNTFLAWTLRNALAQDRAPYFEGSYITVLQMVFPKANLGRRGFTSAWGTLEQGIEKVRQALREHRPELLEQYARWETLTPEAQTAFRLAVYPIQRADFARWNLDLRLVEYFERSHITALLMVFSKANLDRRGFESEWGTLEQGIEKIRAALRQHRPDLVAQYDRWRTLTSEEQTAFRQAVDAIAPQQFLVFGLSTARSRRNAPYFGGFPRTALRMTFSNAFPEAGAVTAPNVPSEQPPHEPLAGPGGGTILEQPNRLLTQGDRLAEEGRTTQAIEAWRKAIQGDDENGVLGFEDVIAHAGTGAIVEAAKLNKALAEARIATAQARLGASAVAAADQEGGMTTTQPSQLPQKVPKPVSTPWRDLLQAQGLDPDQLMDLEQAVKRAADLTQPVYVGVHSSAFFGAPDVAMALTAIQQAVAESLKGGKLLEGEHPPQSALRFVLLVDGATDAKNAKRIAEALAEAMPEASGQSAHLNLELFALTLPAAIDEGRGQELFDLVSTLDGPTDQRGIVGALIGPTEWVESFGHTVTTRQGHEVAAFDSKQQQDGKTLVPGGQLVVQAVTHVVTVKVEARPPDVMPDRQRVIVLPSLRLVGDLQGRVGQYRKSMETKMRSARAA